MSFFLTTNVKIKISQKPRMIASPSNNPTKDLAGTKDLPVLPVNNPGRIISQSPTGVYLRRDISRGLFSGRYNAGGDCPHGARGSHIRRAM